MDKIRSQIYMCDDIYINHSARDEIIPEQFNTEPHTHEVCEILFIKNGSPYYSIDGKEYRLKKNTLVISRSGDRHSIFFKEKGPYERYNILYDEKKLPNGIFEKIPKELDIINFDEGDLVTELFAKTDYYREYFDGDEFTDLLCGITEEIFYNILIYAKNMQSDFGSASSNPIVSRAVLYIKENLATVSGLDELCETLYITKSHLHHLFTKHLLTTPKKYILQLRLEKARSFIRRGKRPGEVYAECGFSDYSTFFRDYKNYFGCSPSSEKELKEVTFQLS